MQKKRTERKRANHVFTKIEHVQWIFFPVTQYSQAYNITTEAILKYIQNA